MVGGKARPKDDGMERCRRRDSIFTVSNGAKELSNIWKIRMGIRLLQVIPGRKWEQQEQCEQTKRRQPVRSQLMIKRIRTEPESSASHTNKEKSGSISLVFPKESRFSAVISRIKLRAPWVFRQKRCDETKKVVIFMSILRVLKCRGRRKNDNGCFMKRNTFQGRHLIVLEESLDT